MLIFDKSKVFFRKAYKDKYLVYISSKPDDICIGMVIKAHIMPIAKKCLDKSHGYVQNKMGWYLSDDDGEPIRMPHSRRIDAAEVAFYIWRGMKSDGE